MHQRIRLQHDQHDNPVILLEGAVTADMQGELTEIYSSLDEKHKRNKIKFDLSMVDYINSAGIAALIAIVTSNEKFGGVIECLHPNKQITHILEVIGLTDILKIVHD